jgi:hypothetical protein
MKCHQTGCEYMAAYRYTWPGRDEAGVCLLHAAKLEQVAAVMDLHLQLIPVVVTYRLVKSPNDGRGIECLLCGHISWNKDDVAKLYCGFCHQFHRG